MSDSLAQTTCQIHFERPASARCPQCAQFYCAECITEHDGKLTCASCLNTTKDDVVNDAAARKSKMDWWQPMPIIHTVIGVLFVWVVFYLVARMITGLPDDFHDGTIWMK